MIEPVEVTEPQPGIIECKACRGNGTIPCLKISCTNTVYSERIHIKGQHVHVCEACSGMGRWRETDQGGTLTRIAVRHFWD